MHTFLQHRRGDPCGRPWKYGLRFKRAPSSAPFGGTFPLGGGRLFCIGSVGSRNQGAVRKPQQNQILRTQAPSGAGFKRRQALLVLRAGNAAMPFRRVPRKWGVQGMSEYEREALILSSPLGASLASFWAPRKKLAAGAAPPSNKRNRSIVAPSSVWPSASHLPLSPLSLRDISP